MYKNFYETPEDIEDENADLYLEEDHRAILPGNQQGLKNVNDYGNNGFHNNLNSDSKTEEAGVQSCNEDSKSTFEKQQDKVISLWILKGIEVCFSVGIRLKIYNCSFVIKNAFSRRLSLTWN